MVHHQLSLGMVLNWWQNDTLNQGLLIVPVCFWLFFTNQQPVDKVKPWWPGLLLFLGATLLIFLGQQTHTRAIAEIGLLSSLLLIPATLYGWQFLRSYWFIFAFALLAFPIWSLITPYAQLLTTWATVKLMSLSSLPIYAEGFVIEIPAGRFIVEEGCSGMRYLVTALAIGSLYAYLSTGKLITKLGMFSLLVGLAIVGNWLRILTVIGIANFWGIDHPMVSDHATLGWIIFAVLLLGWFWLGNRFLPKRDSNNGHRTALSNRVLPRQMYTTALLLLVASVVIPMTSTHFLAAGQYREIDFNDLLAAPWQPANKELWLQPHYPGGLESLYQHGGSSTIAYLIFYQQQADGAELINETNSNFDPDQWDLLERSKQKVSPESKTFTVNEQIIKNSSEGRRLVWSWYEFGHRRSASAFAGKLYDLEARLKKLNGSLVVIFSTPIVESTAASRQRLRQEIAQTWPTLSANLVETLKP